MNVQSAPLKGCCGRPTVSAFTPQKTTGAAARVLAVSPDMDDVLESLREENEALRVRVAHLEATTDEYRRQMAGLLNSWSWRVTAPLRTAAAQARMVRRRIRQVPGRVARRPVAAPSYTA